MTKWPFMKLTVCKTFQNTMMIKSKVMVKSRKGKNSNQLCEYLSLHIEVTLRFPTLVAKLRWLCVSRFLNLIQKKEKVTKMLNK